MTRYIRGFYMALGMFCAFPLPHRKWDDSCINLMLPCLPIVGILFGLIWWGLAELLVLGEIHIVLTAAVLTVTPFLLSGLLHLDGYMDTCDAVLSCRSLEEKVRILKDPHIGAFSVAMVVILFVLQFASVYAILDFGQSLRPLIFIPITSRCCVAAALLCLNTMPQSNYANMLTRNTHVSQKVFVIVLMFAAVVASYLLAGLLGLVTVLLVIGGFIAAVIYSYKEFKGVSGDLAGFSLVISEMCGLIMLGVMHWF